MCKEACCGGLGQEGVVCSWWNYVRYLKKRGERKERKGNKDFKEGEGSCVKGWVS